MIQLIDGKKISRQIQEESKGRIEELKKRGISVSLAFLQVGSDPASTVYMNSQKKACEAAGIQSREWIMPEETTQEELLNLIEQLNNDRTITGILVETPLPHHINRKKVLDAILPSKDMDGFHPQNIGLLAIGEPGFLPCTPAGIVQLLRRSGFVLAGTNCVIVGRSHNVGIPMALLMLRENATVTITHSKTQNLEEICRSADILIAAIGKEEFIGSSYVKEGAVVIDVGMHRRSDGTLCGDVDFEAVKDKVLAITPVPGGVGPMTTAMLINNCVNSIME